MLSFIGWMFRDDSIQENNLSYLTKTDFCDDIKNIITYETYDNIRRKICHLRH